MANLTINLWLKENHPEILKQFLEIKREHKRKQQRERSREIYALAKQAMKNPFK